MATLAFGRSVTTDLPFAKQADDSGDPLPVNPRYGHPTRYQAPAFALVGLTVEL